MSERSVAVDGYLLFGRLAVKYKHVTPEQLKKAIAAQDKARAKGKSYTIGEVCRRLKMLTQTQCEELAGYQQQADVKHEGSYFGYLALVNGFINKEQLAKALKEQRKLKKQGETVPRLGEILTQHWLMNEGQVQAILAAQSRLRERLNLDSGAPTSITQSGRIPVVGERAAAALARLAAFEAKLGAPVEVDLSAAVPEAEAEAVLLPEPPSQFRRTDSRDDIEVHFDNPVDNLFTAQPVAADGGEAAGDGFGLNLDDADAVEAAPATVSGVELEPIQVDAPAAAAKVVAKEQSKKATKSKKTMPKSARPVASTPPKPVPAPAVTATSAAKAKGKAKAKAKAAAGPGDDAAGFRGRRVSGAPGASAEFTPPRDDRKTALLVAAAIAGVILGVYLLTSILIGR